MPKLDPAFARVARRPSVLSLRDDPDEPLELVAGDLSGRTAGHFVDLYSKAGLERVFEEYGLAKRLAAQGLADWRVRISRDDHFRHRLEIVVGGDDESLIVMDMRLHLTRGTWRAGGAEDEGLEVDVVCVDWLSMQNPRATFRADRPPLPGQRHPGTGMGKAVLQLLIILCERTGKDALLNVPEHFHLAVIYRQLGYVVLDAAADQRLSDLERATAGLSLAEAAWAVDRGCVRDDDGAVVRYEPLEMMLPVARWLEKKLLPWAEERERPAPRPLRCDRQALRASLEQEPVPGLVLDDDDDG